ncbi:cyclic nucleotide-binding/CBS domain-containing protein [Nitrosarchaeum koreense]|uniref:Putative signal-transduction protein with CBS domains n=1 Tax=Nitrosarchaeum koreense MY1 TaxID=1001994 RepID=F9CV22_9ARCH|nr:CBS domain-containing protein [Nitrosarchaeum koreense]EGP93137.1 Putative signal-transduction protein with CBS domains [Nitrosarchaeum koreense MY1]
MEFFGSKKNKDASNNNLEKELSQILVKEIMAKELIIAPQSTTIYQISKMMEQGIGSVFVKKDAETMGIITDRDFAIKVAANKYPLDMTVENVASFPVETISPNKSILEAAKKMAAKKIRKLAVSENNKIIGIITTSDIIRQLSKFQK